MAWPSRKYWIRGSAQEPSDTPRWRNRITWTLPPTNLLVSLHTDEMWWWILGILALWIVIALIFALRISRGLGSIGNWDDEDEDL